MKVACIIDSMSRNAGGLYTSVRRMMQEVARVGYTARIFAMRDEHSLEDIHGWDPIPISLSTPIGPRRFGFAAGFDGRLREFAPDLVQTHGLWTYTSHVSQRWHRRTGGPCFIHPHGMLDPWAVNHARWKKRIAGMLFEDRHLQEAGCIRALCREEAEAVRAYGIRAPIAIIPNGIDLPEEIPSLLTRSAPDSGTKDKGPRTLLYIGRIHPKKGLENLIRAWSEVTGHGSRVTERDGWRLVIGGWDELDHENALKRLCLELGVSFSSSSTHGIPTRNEEPRTKNGEAITFLGPVYGEAKDALLRSADAFILPSFSEGLPMTILEAWAYRLPVVMTPPCNLPEGFAAGAALRVEPEADSIARGLADLFAMPTAALREMGERGRQLVEARFLWPAIAKQVAEVHEWLLGGGAKPGFVE